jgi:SAM-dependent methyltransferase
MSAIIFDQPHSQRYMKAMADFLQWVLPELGARNQLVTALDSGCGIGLLADHLQRSGLQVKGFDGRQENVQEARRRFPTIPFKTANVESPEVTGLGHFDLVLCFGLLYHLENPFAALRNLHVLTKQVLLLQSICTPWGQPILMLRDECRGEDQGLNYVAFYPSESALVKMCYKVGFPFVYRSLRLPDHEDFRATRRRKQFRTILSASKRPLDSPSFSLLAEPTNPLLEPWNTAWGTVAEVLARAVRFAGKPWPAKMKLARRFLGKIDSR